MELSIFLLFLFFTLNIFSSHGEYSPTWESLDSRPLPGWYDKAKIGIFIHWGVYSVPGWGGIPSGSTGEWFWWVWKGAKLPMYQKFMKENYPPGFTYADFAPQFTAKLFNPDYWADIFKASGARYVVLTSKHHEGYTNWPSPVSWNWNSMDVGPHRDLVGELTTALRKQNLTAGLYYSLFEWFNPLYLADKANKFQTQNFVQEKAGPELYDIINRYQPEVLWTDGDWEAHDSYWNATNFLAWLYNDSPVKDTIVVNDRWGSHTSCKHGGYFTCGDHYNPGVLMMHKWENAMTIDRLSWGYRRNAILPDFLTIEQIIENIAKTVSCNGNILINIGPTPDGRIQPIFEERLRQLGSWLGVNGEAIYDTTYWALGVQHDSITPGVWYTFKEGVDFEHTVYAIMLRWPKYPSVFLGSVPPYADLGITMLGLPGYLTWQKYELGGIEITLPSVPVSELPCQWAWVLKITGIIL